MKTFFMKNKKAQGIVMAVVLGGVPFVTSFPLKAESIEMQQLSESSRQEKQKVIAFLQELREYAHHFVEATKVLFLLEGKGHNVTKQHIQEEYQQLSSKIGEIHAKCAHYAQTLQEETHKALMAKLHKLIQSLTKCQNQLKGPLSKLESLAYLQAMNNVKKSIETEFKTIISHTRSIEKQLESDHIIQPVFASIKEEIVTTLICMQNNPQSLIDGVKHRAQKRK